jgi:hypothetical protein
MPFTGGAIMRSTSTVATSPCCDGLHEGGDRQTTSIKVSFDLSSVFSIAVPVVSEKN